ncbi:DUF4209 domain-containing protein [Noviherbaspirillum album]|uniref:DUF4209 domain-containing protein n=1 Tax=Noviherbaspirillum album TaxID=3080276 RepID=UPI00345FEA4B
MWQIRGSLGSYILALIQRRFAYRIHHASASVSGDVQDKHFPLRIISVSKRNFELRQLVWHGLASQAHFRPKHFTFLLISTLQLNRNLPGEEQGMNFACLPYMF